jgi:hypothetical protein
MLTKTVNAKQNFGDIFYLRERLINDLHFKNNLEKIKTRVSDIHFTQSKKKKKYRKEKTMETFLPKIQTESGSGSRSGCGSPEDTHKRRLFSLENSPVIKNEVYGKMYLESKRKVEIAKKQEIQKNNESFVQKLSRIHSPLNRNQMTNSYNNVIKYKSIAKGTKTTKEMNKILDTVKDHLPRIICEKKNQQNQIHITGNVNYVYTRNFLENFLRGFD